VTSGALEKVRTAVLEIRLALLADDVPAPQVEIPRGLEHMAVIRIDLLKAMLLGARQVQRVTGSEHDRAPR
jgi:hypothetical protein